MKATSIPAYENTFANTGKDSHGKQFILSPKSVKFNNNTEVMNYVDCKRSNNDSSFYTAQEIEKKRIVLHFTEGYLKGDIATLTQPGNMVSTPFVIARNGTIYNLWASKFWSYHLGPGAVGGNTDMSKSSIGIEISNIGPLKKVGNNLVTQYGNTDVYCSLNDTHLYHNLSPAYRGNKYYAAFTTAQYNAVISLLRFLTNKYNIPRSFLAVPNRYNLFTSNAEAIAYRGICSHVNFRPVGEKVDIGPAFNWDMVIQAVQAS
ncbi:MAG: N-acetylmuramoyl-L-alanine amidase [Chitinophagaceae bacterium]